MKRTFIALLSGVLMLAGARSSMSQTQEPSSAVNCPSTATLDDLIKAIDAGVTGAADKDRTCFRALFLPEGRLIPLGKNADGGFSPHILTVDGWVEAVKKRGHANLYEHQIKVATQVYGHLAHLWSTYETRVEEDGKVTADVKGINSIQAVNDGKGWKIQEIMWEAETPTELIPKEYLP
jgi:hypothetical protein